MQEIRIRLCGGPEEIPDEERNLTVPADYNPDKVRVRFLAGYEHFVCVADGQHDETLPGTRRYMWSYRTAIAE